METPFLFKLFNNFPLEYLKLKMFIAQALITLVEGLLIG